MVALVHVYKMMLRMFHVQLVFCDLGCPLMLVDVDVSCNALERAHALLECEHDKLRQLWRIVSRSDALATKKRVFAQTRTMEDVIRLMTFQAEWLTRVLDVGLNHIVAEAKRVESEVYKHKSVFPAAVADNIAKVCEGGKHPKVTDVELQVMQSAQSKVPCNRDLVGYVVVPRYALKQQDVLLSQSLGLTDDYGLTAEKQPLAATLDPLVGWFSVETRFDRKQGQFLYIAFTTPGVKWCYFAERRCRDVMWENWRDWWRDIHPLEYAAFQFAPYRKMQKRGDSESAVLQQMKQDGVSADDIALFFGEAGGAGEGGSGGGGASDPRFSKYSMMQKSGLPEGAVRHQDVDGEQASDLGFEGDIMTVDDYEYPMPHTASCTPH